MTLLDDASKRQESHGGKEAQEKPTESEETKDTPSKNYKTVSAKTNADDDLARKRRKSSGGILESHPPEAVVHPEAKLKKRHCSSAAEANLTSRSSTSASPAFSTTDQTRYKLCEALTALLGTLTLLTQLCSDRIRIMDEVGQPGPSSAKPRSSESTSSEKQVDNQKGSSESKADKSDSHDP